MDETLHESDKDLPIPSGVLLDKKIREAKEQGIRLEYLKPGFNLLNQGEAFAITDETGQIKGEMRILPATIQYKSSSGRVMYVDTYGVNPILHGSLEEIEALPFNVLQLARDSLKKHNEGISTSPDIIRTAPSNLLSVRIPENPTPKVRKIIERLEEIKSLKTLLDTVFGKDGNKRSLIDIGSSDGKFCLELAHKKGDLNIGRIVASDVTLEYFQQYLQKLQKSNVEIRQVDIKKLNDLKEKFDIVTLNAPYAVGKQAFAKEAIEASLGLVSTPGVVLLRLNESSDDLGFQPQFVIPKQYPLIRFQELKGLPNTPFTTLTWSPRKGQSSNTYVLLNI